MKKIILAIILLASICEVDAMKNFEWKLPGCSDIPLPENFDPESCTFGKENRLAFRGLKDLSSFKIVNIETGETVVSQKLDGGAIIISLFFVNEDRLDFLSLEDKKEGSDLRRMYFDIKNHNFFYSISTYRDFQKSTDEFIELFGSDLKDLKKYLDLIYIPELETPVFIIKEINFFGGSEKNNFKHGSTVPFFERSSEFFGYYHDKRVAVFGGEDSKSCRSIKFLRFNPKAETYICLRKIDLGSFKRPPLVSIINCPIRPYPKIFVYGHGNCDYDESGKNKFEIIDVENGTRVCGYDTDKVGIDFVVSNKKGSFTFCVGKYGSIAILNSNFDCVEKIKVFEKKETVIEKLTYVPSGCGKKARIIFVYNYVEGDDDFYYLKQIRVPSKYVDAPFGFSKKALGKYRDVRVNTYY